MKWWQASLVVVLFYLAVAALEVGWHRYIATGLPMAAFMRHAYLSTDRFGHRGLLFAITDFFFPTLALGAGIGAIGRRQRVLFAIIHGAWVGPAMVALMPLYGHWLHPPVPQPHYWPLYPLGWKLVAYAVEGLGAMELTAIGAQHSFRPSPDGAKKTMPRALPGVNAPGGSGQPPQGDYKTDAARVAEIRSTTHCSLQQAIAIVDRERAVRRAQRQGGASGSGGAASMGQSPEDSASPYGAAGGEDQPPVYTPRQIDGAILIMYGRGWSVERAAKNFHIPLEELRERIRNFSPKLTPEQLSGIIATMREKCWTVTETAERYHISEDAIRRRLEEIE